MLNTRSDGPPDWAPAALAGVRHRRWVQGLEHVPHDQPSGAQQPLGNGALSSRAGAELAAK